MENKEVIELGKLFEKDLNYRGFNLWEMCEGAVFNHFLKEPKKIGFLEKLKARLMRPIIIRKDLEREAEMKPEEEVQNTDLLFVAFDVSHVNTFIPIMKNLDNFKIIRFDSPANELTKETLEKKEIKYMNLDAYMTPEIEKRLREAKKWLAKAWKKIRQDKELKEKLGDKYEPGIDTLEYFCATRKRFLEVIRYIELYEELFKKVKPKKVLCVDDVNPIGRILALTAKKNNIPSFVLQHGSLSGNPVGKIVSDKMIVNGIKDKEFLIQNGATEEKIVVTGQPRFDEMATLQMTREEACKKFGLDPNKKIIVFAAQKNVAGENITQSALDLFLKKLDHFDQKKYNFVLKLHPIQEEKEYKKYGSKVKVMKDENINEVLLCADVLLTAFSTVAIESVLLGTPVVTINLGDDSYIDYSKDNVGFRILKEEDFLPTLRKVLYDEEFKKEFLEAKEKFIANYNYKLDGKATKRILEILDREIAQ
ncbi:MAG: CDP-glycerol glycerophosphotransferase family protein [Patescibacteria group bacterium]